MDETALLRTIRPVWIQRITLSLAKGAGMRDDIRMQLERFFDLLEQMVDTGDPSWLDSILYTWSSSLTQTDLEGKQSNLTQFLREIMLQTHQICRDMLDNAQAMDLLTALVPGFAYAFEKAANFEMEARVAHTAEQLKQAQLDLERLDQSKSNFIAVAAHELKTPLTLIEGYTAMLQEVRAKNGITLVETEFLEGIDTGARRLQAIIDDMIDVSLIDTNLMQLHFQPVWINRILNILQTELETATKERSQIFEVKEFPGSADMTFCDPERLMQVLRNVLTNAIKYTPDGGKISIDGRKLPGFIEIIIHDTGIGIAPEDQSIIFEKFTRLGSTALHSSGKTKYKGGGPGLGLHIAKGIIEAHGGAIWVESPGYDEKEFPGSTFHILMPLLTAPPETHMARLLTPLLSTKPYEEKAL